MPLSPIDALVDTSVPVDPVRAKVGPVGPVRSNKVPVGSVDVPVGSVDSNGGPCRCPPCLYRCPCRSQSMRWRPSRSSAYEGSAACFWYGKALISIKKGSRHVSLTETTRVTLFSMHHCNNSMLTCLTAVKFLTYSTSAEAPVTKQRPPMDPAHRY